VGHTAGLEAVVKINSHPLSGLELPIIQPVAQRYTNELSRLSVVRLAAIKIQGSSPAKSSRD
jgi:hypothetical protein